MMDDGGSRTSARAMLLAGVAVCTLLTAVACDGDRASVARAAPATTPPSRSSAALGLPVETVTVDVPLSLPSRLYVEHDAIVAARSAGPIESLFADLGTHVRAGQTLATIESASQQIALAKAREAYENSGRIVRRVRAMSRFGGTTAADSEQAESQHQQAELALRQARRDLELTRVVAPFAGVVTARYARSRRLVAVGDTLFAVTESAPLLARVRVPESAAGAIRIGTSAKVSGPGLAGGVATVIRLSPAIDPASGTREAILRLGSDVRLLPGSSVVVHLGGERRRVVAVPRDAIGPDGTALVLEDDRTTLRSVTLGADLGAGRVEVVSGLNPGERIVRPDRP